MANGRRRNKRKYATRSSPSPQHISDVQLQFLNVWRISHWQIVSKQKKAIELGISLVSDEIALLFFSASSDNKTSFVSFDSKENLVVLFYDQANGEFKRPLHKMHRFSSGLEYKAGL